MCWIVFCVLHSLLAAVSVKQKIAERFRQGFKYYRLYYTVFAFISFGAVLGYQLYLYSPLLYVPSAAIKILGGGMGTAGLWIMAICIKKYFNQLSGLRTLFINEVKTGNSLLITGIHRHIRHPLYLGTFLFIWGLFILLPVVSLFISNLVITVYTLIGITFEERKLVQEFGDTYKTYQKTVPKIVPSFKLRTPAAEG